MSHLGHKWPQTKCTNQSFTENNALVTATPWGGPELEVADIVWGELFNGKLGSLGHGLGVVQQYLSSAGKGRSNVVMSCRLKLKQGQASSSLVELPNLCVTTSASLHSFFSLQNCVACLLISLLIPVLPWKVQRLSQNFCYFCPPLPTGWPRWGQGQSLVLLRGPAVTSGPRLGPPPSEGRQMKIDMLVTLYILRYSQVQISRHGTFIQRTSLIWPKNFSKEWSVLGQVKYPPKNS